MTPLGEIAGRGRFLRPRALFLGAACAFAACCLAGRYVSRLNHYPHFTRFHQMISPRSLHYPTASQCLAVAEADLPPDRVAVVVGGDSVLFGTGQAAGEVWTAHLQRRLGDGFRVYNFGLCGGCPGEFGAVAAEALARRHRAVICVTDARAGTSASAGEPGAGTQPYFFWDAYCKGLLSDHPERDAYLAGPAAASACADGPEARRRGRVESLTYAHELWTAVSCRAVSTAWCPVPGGQFLAPRRSFADTEPSFPPEKRYPPGSTEGTVALLNQVVRQRHAPGAAAAADDLGHTTLVESFRRCFPPSRRPGTLVLVNHKSPYVLRRLDPAVREWYLSDFPETVRALRQAGFAAAEVCAGYTELDFIDSGHLSPEGAVKLAAEVAPRVRQMAAELGYTE
jgi:hypothetical protein